MKLECVECKTKAQLALKRCKHFELGGERKQKGQALQFWVCPKENFIQENKREKEQKKREVFIYFTCLFSILSLFFFFLFSQKHHKEKYIGKNLPINKQKKHNVLSF